MSWHQFAPYVPVGVRKANAAKEVAKRFKKGSAACPVCIQGRKITASFWGDAWCKNLEAYGDFANRLPRGATYVRNGSVVHLAIEAGTITALVSGSELYEIRIDIAALAKPHWAKVKSRCAGQIGTLVELLQGKLSSAVMAVVTDRDGGLFPKPKEIEMSCSCPDDAGMCKHLAAAMYGIGHRLDKSPELLFLLRGVDHLELIEQAIPAAPAGMGKGKRLATADLGAVFGIDLDEPAATTKPAKAKGKKAAGPAKKRAVPKKG